MFTGLVHQLGQIVEAQRQAQGLRLAVRPEHPYDDLIPGESIAVDGVCLTVQRIENDTFWADVVEETLERSTLARITKGTWVNLERALRPGDRFGGHFVQGHVDATARILRWQQSGVTRWLDVELPGEYEPLVVEKGSIAVDGISLTVATIGEAFFRVAVVPFTFEKTTLKMKKPGDRVNLEFDLLAKYVQKMVGAYRASAHKITEQWLKEHGFDK
jgi:riboflavin synthase